MHKALLLLLLTIAAAPGCCILTARSPIPIPLVDASKSTGQPGAQGQAESVLVADNRRV